MNRKYELKERALRQAETRQRIVEAAVGLHTSVGPARTTISGIAERAGVERHTVYAHFPDDRTLFRACSEHWEARHPLPDFETLGEIEDPLRRLRHALGELYAWYESVEADLALFIRDASVVPANADVLDEMTAGFRAGRIRGARAPKTEAASFRTLRDLVGHGSRPPPKPSLVLSWLDHTDTTAEERRLEALLGTVQAAVRSASISRLTARRSSAVASICRTRSRVSPSLRPISSSDFGSSAPSRP